MRRRTRRRRSRRTSAPCCEDGLANVIDQAGVISRVHVGFGEESLGEIIDDINALLVAPKAAPAVASAGAAG